MLDADFEGGSLDNVEDAIAQLDSAGRPYIMFLLSTMTDGRVVAQLTPNAKQLFRDMYEEGSLDELLETALYGEE
jgi:hypothetical protein